MSEISAYHEAGHAFMAIYVEPVFVRVTIEPDWDDGPDRHADIQVEWPLDQFTDRELHEKSVLVALAGPVAEMIHSGEPLPSRIWSRSGPQIGNRLGSCGTAFSDERKRLAYLEQTTVQLYRLLNRDHHWAALGGRSLTICWRTRRWTAERWKISSGNGFGRELPRKFCRRRNKSRCRRIVYTVGKKCGEPSRVFRV